MEGRYRIKLFGGVRVSRGDREITRFSTQKAAALLAYLAYHLDQAHPREVLAELLWPGRTPKQGRASLSTALSSLRRQLEPPGVARGAVVESDRFSVQLNPAVVTTDVIEFQAAIEAAGDADSTTERTQHLSDAVALYQGELLPGFYEDWVLIEQRKLADQYFEAAVKLTVLLERAEDLDRAVEIARLALTHDPLREEAHGELMRLYAALGQPAAALRQYAELKELLEEELGRPPSPSTEQLAREIQARPPDLHAPKVAQRPPPRQVDLPTGAVTFLLTDIEGSTALFERLGDSFREVLDTHHALLRAEFDRYDAEEIRGSGDSFIVPFASAGDAVACAVACQRAVGEHEWPTAVGELRVRMALYTSDVKAQEGDYRDVVLHRASRVLSAAHGGQILCAEAAATLLKRDLAPELQLVDLGVFRLRDLAAPERLFQVSYPDMPQAEFPPPRAEAGYAGNLPLQLTRFFGRDEELDQLRELLTDEELRLLTLTGSGGSGKTRLALEAARSLIEAYNGAVWFVPLADLSDAGLIGGAVADALDLPRSPHIEPLEQASNALGRQSALLILDNLEQFGGDAAPVVHELLEGARALTCLATSRQRLGLPGEREFEVMPLPTPTGGQSPEALARYDSVRLCVDRAQLARPDFQVTQANADPIATLCERLDGIPLAIELAAARAHVLTPSEMVAQLEHPFDFLVSRRQVTAERHRTLAAALDWSYRLLTPELQRFFCRLSVFRGGWTLEAAEAVCGEPKALDYLEQLRECSMVLTEETDLGMRFRMLETLRQYGRERLGDEEWDELCWQHAEYFVEFAEEAERHFRGPREAEWLGRLEPDHGNLRMAFAWATGDGSSGEMGLRLAAALWPYWWRYGYSREGLDHLRDALEAADNRPRRVRARAVYGSAMLTFDCGREERAVRPLLHESLKLSRACGDKAGEADALAEIGVSLVREGMYAEAEPVLDEALRLSRASRRNWSIARALNGKWVVANAAGMHEAALAHIEQSVALFRNIGDRHEAFHAIHYMKSTLRQLGSRERHRQAHREQLELARKATTPNLRPALLLAQAGYARYEGDIDEAEKLIMDAMALGQQMGHSPAWELFGLARIAEARGDYQRAKSHLEHALSTVPRQPNRVRFHLYQLGRVAHRLGTLRRAAKLFGAWEALGGGIDTIIQDARPDDPLWGSNEEFDWAGISDEARHAAWSEGRAMTLEKAVEYALSDDDAVPEPQDADGE